MCVRETEEERSDFSEEVIILLTLYSSLQYAVLLLLLLVIQFVMFSISYAASTDVLPDSLRQGFDELWDVQNTSNGTLSAYEQWVS